jgi:zinc/manganese transport system ATP-binding protein
MREPGLQTSDPGGEGALALEVEDLRAVLGGRPVLNGVSFALEAGRFCGLIGSNGAGKTTLLRTILGLQAPAGGTVRIGAGPAAGPRRGPPAVGYVPQRVLLDPDLPLRARDLVALGLDGHRAGLPLPSPARRRQVDEMLAAVGAEAFADQRVGRLSGGQQQRVLIAHALVRRPPLLLLDEPLSSLDPGSAAEIVALLGRLAAVQRVAILLSAHDINPLLGEMDRVVYLARGRAASGPVAEVVRGDVLSDLYGHHVDVLRVHGRVLVVVAPGGDVPDPAGHATVVGGREA